MPAAHGSLQRRYTHKDSSLHNLIDRLHNLISVTCKHITAIWRTSCLRDKTYRAPIVSQSVYVLKYDITRTANHVRSEIFWFICELLLLTTRSVYLRQMQETRQHGDRLLLMSDDWARETVQEAKRRNESVNVLITSKSQWNFSWRQSLWVDLHINSNTFFLVMFWRLLKRLLIIQPSVA